MYDAGGGANAETTGGCCGAAWARRAADCWRYAIDERKARINCGHSEGSVRFMSSKSACCASGSLAPICCTSAITVANSVAEGSRVGLVGLMLLTDGWVEAFGVGDAALDAYGVS